MTIQEKIANGSTFLGIEFGSTRIKACLTDDTYAPIADGSHEWENRLGPEGFVRVSQSELIALHQVHAFDLSLAGTICIRMADGTVTYASRRYVAKLKNILGL